jgi:hypothetical protein
MENCYFHSTLVARNCKHEATLRTAETSQNYTIASCDNARLQTRRRGRFA